MDHLYHLANIVRQADTSIECIERLKEPVPEHLRAAFRIELERIEKRLAQLRKDCAA